MHVYLCVLEAICSTNKGYSNGLSRRGVGCHRRYLDL